MKSLIRIAAACVLLLGANSALAQDDPDIDYVETPPAGITDVTGYGEDDNTNAGETVENTASVTYSVNSVPQNAEINDPAATFVVDRVILFTVASAGGVDVSPEGTGEALEFSVQNDSNDTLDFLLAASNVGSGDQFQANGLALYRDDTVNGTPGSYDVEDDAIAGNRLTNIAEGVSVTVFVVSSIPDSDTVDDGDTANVVLLATAYNTAAEGGGIVTEDEGTADDPNAEDTVFGDVDGDFANGVDDDIDEDGQHSDTGTYTVATASITVEKSSTVISDPFNGISADAKAIPGAVVEYCILVKNAGDTEATDVAMTDPIPDFTTFVEGSIQIAADCAGTGAVDEDDDTDDNTPVAGDETGTSGSFDSTYDAGYGGAARGRIITEVTSLAAPVAPATETQTATIFRVTID